MVRCSAPPRAIRGCMSSTRGPSTCLGEDPRQHERGVDHQQEEFCGGWAQPADQRHAQRRVARRGQRAAVQAFQPLHYWWGYRKAGLAKFIYGARESEMAKCFGGRSDQCKRLTDRLSGGIAFHMNERLLARNRKYYPPAAGSVCGWLFDELGVMDIAKTDEDAHQAFMCKLCVDAFHQQNRRAFEGNMCATQGSSSTICQRAAADQRSPLRNRRYTLAMPSPLNSSTM